MGGREALIRFTYNARCDYWSFGIYDMEESPVLAMCKILPRAPLTHFYGSLDLPSGVFGVLTDLDHIGREAFMTHEARFVFIPQTDFEEAI